MALFLYVMYQKNTKLNYVEDPAKKLMDLMRLLLQYEWRYQNVMGLSRYVNPKSFNMADKNLLAGLQILDHQKTLKARVFYMIANRRNISHWNKQLFCRCPTPMWIKSHLDLNNFISYVSASTKPYHTFRSPSIL